MSKAQQIKRARESRRFAVSLIVPTVIAIIGAALAATGIFDRNLATGLLVVGAIASVGALSLLSANQGPANHILGSILIVSLFGGMIWWVRSYARPIFDISLGGIVVVRDSPAPGLFVEAAIENSGHQSSYAKDWRLILFADGAEYRGKEYFGQNFPAPATGQVSNEAELYNQEFPPGKLVRGWLFFAFPSLPRFKVMQLFTCDPAATSDGVIELSVHDSRTQTPWTEQRNISRMRQESCRQLADKR